MSKFRPYRFSPVTSRPGLFKAINHIHFSCHELSLRSFGKYLPVTGNIGIFCHYDDEFALLKQMRDEITLPTDNSDLKYYQLRSPITISPQNGVPEAIYTHLYIRRPDPYRYQTGDIDFVIDSKTYKKVWLSLKDARHSSIPGARIFERSDLDMIELYDPDIDALAYLRPSR